MLFLKSAQLLDHAALLYVLMTTNDMNSSNANYTVVCVADFFTVKHSGKEHLFLKGKIYISLPGSQIHSYNGSQLVKP